MIFISYLITAQSTDLLYFIPELIGANTLIIILLSIVPFLNRRIQAGWSTGFIIFVAAVLRLIFIRRSPELSDDIFRYLFDGLMFLKGRNPYTAAPAAFLTDDSFLSALITRINHPYLPTIYPPAAQFVFAAGAAMGGLAGIKLLLIMLDLLSCLLIIFLLDKLKRDRAWAVLYAWHPLPVIEIAASGHIDAAAIFFILSALAVIINKNVSSVAGETVLPMTRGSEITRACTAGILFSAAALTKWVPLIFLPGILLMTPSGSRKYAATAFLTATLAMIWFFRPEVANSFHTLSVYAANWEFSGFVFRLIRSLTGSGSIARAVIACGFSTLLALMYFRYFRTALPSSLMRAKKLLEIFYALSLSFLLLTPTLHPWYALYLAAFLPFAAGPAGIILSWSVFLAYRVLIFYGMTGQWVENDFIPLMIIIGPAAAFIAAVIIRSINRSQKWRLPEIFRLNGAIDSVDRPDQSKRDY